MSAESTIAKAAVLAVRPQAIARHDDKHDDWAIFDGYGGAFMGLGTREDDAWRDALARLNERPRRERASPVVTDEWTPPD